MRSHDRLKVTTVLALWSIIGAAASAFGIDLRHEHFIRGIEAREGYHAVRGLALSPDESLLYAAHWQAGTEQSDDPIAVYTLPDYTLVRTISGGQCVGNVVTSNDGRYVYAPEYYGGYIHRYDTWNHDARASIHLGSWAQNVWRSPDGERAIVLFNADSGPPYSRHWLALIDISGDSFSLIDCFDAERPVTTPPAGMSAAFSNDGQHIYLACCSSVTAGPTLIDVEFGETFRIVREVELVGAPGQAWSMAGVVRSGGTLFVGDKTGSKLHIVDEATFTKIDEVSLPESPWNIALHPDGQHLFVMYGDSGTLSVMDLSTLSEVTRLSGLRYGLLDAVFTTDGSRIYLSHYHQAEGGITFLKNCPGDLDGDGDVDLADLAELLAHYGDVCR